jgi:uncharacterized protein YeaO (DUF488 family)
VRRPPRGVRRQDIAKQDYYDVWLPVLAPSPPLVKQGLAATTDAQWNAFARKYRAEMKAPAAAHVLDLLAALSRESSFAVGCYCEDETRCHRSILRELLAAHGATLLG